MSAPNTPKSNGPRVLLILLVAILAIVVATVALRKSRRAGPNPVRPAPTATAAAAPSNPASANAAGAPTAPNPAGAGPDFRTELDQARGFRDPMLRSREFGRILQLWLAQDSGAALAYLRALPRDSAEFTQGLLLTLTAVAQRDPAKALALARELAATRDQQTFYSSYFAEATQRDPAGAAQQLSQVPEGTARENALRAVADTWAQKDFAAAMAWAQKLEGADRNIAIESALTDLVVSDPLRAIQLAQENLVGAALERTLGNALHQLVTSDPAAAAAIVPLLPGGQTQTLAAAEVAKAYAAKSPREAVAWALQLPSDSPARMVAVARALETWAVSDPLAASGYVSAMPADRLQQDAAIAIAVPLTNANPSSAVAWAESLPAGTLRAATLASVADAWARHDPEAATRWIAGQPADALGAQAASALNGALSYWVLHDADAARAFVGTLPAASQANAAAFVAPLLAQHEPVSTLSWTQALPHEAARDAATASAYARWAENDPAAARSWLAQANLSPELKARLQRSTR